MGIEAVWKTERGEELDRVSDSKMVLSRLTQSFSRLEQSACLRFLDPAGDACFNQLQLPSLEAELRIASSTAVHPKDREHIEDLLSLVHRAKRSHTYLWFIGD